MLAWPTLYNDNNDSDHGGIRMGVTLHLMIRPWDALYHYSWNSSIDVTMLALLVTKSFPCKCLYLRYCT